jgi:hypothetical protein
MSLPVWQSRRTEWGGGGGIWVKCAPLLAIATLGLKSCTDLKCVRCCMYGPVHTTTFCGERSPPPSLSPAAVTGRTTHRNLNTSCRCCMRRPARYYLRPRLRRKVSLALARPLPKSGSVFFGLPLVVVGAEDQRVTSPLRHFRGAQRRHIALSDPCLPLHHTVHSLFRPHFGHLAAFATARPAPSVPSGRTPRAVTF